MDDDHRHDQPARELRLEGAGLFVVGGLFLAALALAFYAGRWVERRADVPVSSPGLAETTADGAGTAEPDLNVGQETTYFDTVSGDGKEAEPGREVARETEKEEPEPRLAVTTLPSTPPTAEPETPAADGGPFYVQLFAGRDRSSAEALVRALNDRGYRVRLDTERSGEGSLYKVRVGGYAAKPDAQVLAERLRGEGYSGAWVTRVD